MGNKEILRELKELRGLIEEMRNRQEMYYIHPPESLTFDDVSLFAHKESTSHSRKDDDVYINGHIAPNLELSVAGVCASYMEMSNGPFAAELARNGGYAQLSRLMPPEEQAEAIEGVKRSDKGFIANPYEVYPHTTVGELKEEWAKKGVKTFVVVNGAKELVGVVTRRDVNSSQSDSQPVSSIMTPFTELITASETMKLPEAKRLILDNKIQQIPIIGENQEVKGLISLDGIQKMENPIATRDKHGRLAVGGTVGLPKKDNGEVDIDRIVRETGILVDAEADSITLAVANAYLTDVLVAVEALRSNFPKLALLAGTVDDHRGALRLFRAGADTALVGIGPGAACETRTTAGVGIGQFTALRIAQRAKQLAQEELGREVFIISDGGVASPHQFVKALFAGADGVSMGRVFADTNESATAEEKIDGKPHKMYRGLASQGAKEAFDKLQNREIREEDRTDKLNYVYKHVAEEGIEESWLPLSGPLVEKIRYIVGGLRSAMTYHNSKTLDEFRQVCDYGVLCDCDLNHYMRVTDAVRLEGKPHDLESYRT